MSFQFYRYNKEIDKDFANELRTEVNNYFNALKLSKHANTRMIIKTIIMLSLFLVPYFLMITGSVEGVFTHYLLWGIMGLASAGIGMTVMHDAIHGAYSSKPKVNKLLGNTMNFLGGNSWVWHMQHNVLHHTYPNVEELDDDIDLPPFLRMSPHQKRYFLHRYQHIYIWFLYAFSTIFWILNKDYVMLAKYKERGMLKKGEFGKRLAHILSWKVIYYGYLIVIPMLTIDYHWSTVLGMFLVMHLISGLFLSFIFQPAHVFEGSEYAQKQNQKTLDRGWFKYQLETTTNFQLNPFLNYFAGGLNYQIEHHLFPHICHIHYKNLSPIVERLAEKHGLPYYNQPNLGSALYLHYLQVKELGQNEFVHKLQFN